MVDYATAPLSEIKDDILKDGRIGPREVKKLRKRLLENMEGVGAYEAEFMIAVNEAVIDAWNTPGYAQLYYDVLLKYLVKEGLTPGWIDDSEAEWIEERIMRDGEIGDRELKLLKMIEEKAEAMPDTLKAFISGLPDPEEEAGGDGGGSLMGRLKGALKQK